MITVNFSPSAVLVGGPFDGRSVTVPVMLSHQSRIPEWISFNPAVDVRSFASYFSLDDIRAKPGDVGYLLDRGSTRARGRPVYTCRGGRSELIQAVGIAGDCAEDAGAGALVEILRRHALALAGLPDIFLHLLASEDYALKPVILNPGDRHDLGPRYIYSRYDNTLMIGFRILPAPPFADPIWT